jgi:predicted  nucleic acid-binding Zn-ribbon protein
MVEVLRESHPKARKVHSCTWCGEDIPKGETHYAQACKDCDAVYTVRFHVECEKAFEEYWRGLDNWDKQQEPAYDEHMMVRGKPLSSFD